MQQYLPQDEIRRDIISNMVKKRKAIVPVIGEDTIVDKNNTLYLKFAYQGFGWVKDGSKWVFNEDLLQTFPLSYN